MMRLRALAIALLLAASPALAAPSKADIARAADLKKKGDEQVHASHFREGLELYDQAYAINPDPAILYNRGRAREQLGEYAEALEQLEKFASDAPPALRGKVPNLDKMIADMKQKVASVAIQTSLAGATVVIRGKTIGTTPLSGPIRLNAGDASVDVMADGYKTFHKDLKLAAGETATVDVALEKVGGSGGSSVEPQPLQTSNAPPPASTGGKPGSGWKILTFGAGGLGIASIGAGMVFFGLALGDKGTVDAHCPNKACDPMGRSALNEASAFAAASTVLVVLGAISLAAGATAFIITPRGAPVEARAFLGPEGGGVGGTF
jgi:hypothetical protein